MANVSEYLALLAESGSDAIYHRQDDTPTPCPCRTPEGFRDPEWHLLNPGEPLCDANGMLPGLGDVTKIVKGFVQPIQSTRATRLSAEYIAQLFGEVKADDHLGIFPIEWGGTRLNFYDWGQSGEDWIEYAGRRFIAVNANMIADPADGNPEHHWEVGLRLMRTIT